MKSAGYLSNHLARLFAQALNSEIGKFGIKIGQFPALLELWNNDGLTQKELVARLDIEQATMANTLARMERDGLITRKTNPEDARSQQAWLTDKAKALHQPALAAAKSINEKALKDFNEDERDEARAIFLRMINNLKV